MSGYDFSPLYHSDAGTISPGSTFLAITHSSRLIIRLTNNLRIVRTWSIAASGEKKLDSVQWSDDGAYILVFSRELRTGWVFGLAEEGSGDAGEVARVNAGEVDGLERLEWVRGGREILGWTEHGLRLLVFSLATGETRTISNPKSGTAGITYSPDARYFAALERHGGRDSVGIYDTADSFRLVRNFALPTTDAQSLSWSSCGRYFAIADSYLSYSVYIHSPIGLLLSHFSPSSRTFEGKFSASSASASSPASSSKAIQSFSSNEDPGLGVSDMTWSPTGRHLGISSWDGKVRILESDHWHCISVLASPSRVSKNVPISQEPAAWLRDTKGRGIVQFDRIASSSVFTTTKTIDSAPPLPPHAASFSPSARYIRVTPVHQPNTAHIYTFLPSLASSPNIRHLHVITFLQPIKSALWSTTSALAAGASGISPGDHQAVEKCVFITKQGAVYTWDEEGWVDVDGRGASDAEDVGVVEGVGIPNAAKFAPIQIQFSPDGSSLMIQGKREFCMMYNVPPDADSGPAASAAVPTWETEGLSFVQEEEEEEEEGPGWQPVAEGLLMCPGGSHFGIDRGRQSRNLDPPSRAIMSR